MAYTFNFIRQGRLLFMTAIVFAVLLLPSIGLATDEDEDQSSSMVDVQSYVSDMQPGWNLGNSFDAVGDDETAWGNPYVTKELIENIAGQGYNSIRIPVTFDERMLEEEDYTIDSEFLDRVDQTVQWALEEDMYVMINVHHDSWTWIEEGMQENHDETLARYRSIWTQLSEHFKDHSMKLMFESINEPRFWGSDSEQDDYLYELNTAFHQIVRESGGLNDVRPLVLPTLDTGLEPEKLDVLYDTILELDDPNLISTVHFYGFWPFSVNVDGHTTFDDETKQDIIDTFDRVHDTFVANEIPVIIGEYGLLGFDTDINAIQQGEKLKFFEYMLHYAKEKDLTHMLWDNGQHFGRESFTWSDPALYEMMKTSWDTRSATAESDFIYLKKDEKITDVELELNLHGNQFQALQLDGQDLEAGVDYELNDEVLTVKADLLSDLDRLDERGTKAVLKAQFDKGVDWDINVISYDTATLEDVDGEARNFAIPTNFNGDQLATIEAVDNNGDPVGPQDWTPFKEFAYTFSPDYDAHEIILKEAFFNEVDDGEVDLTFHFWSGETIDYTLLKEGDNIEGMNDEETAPSTDTSALTELIETAESHLDEAGIYTQDSLSTLTVAIDTAQQSIETIDSEEALQEEIASLQAAIDGLQKIEHVKEVKTTPDISDGKATIASEDIEKLASNGQFIIDMRDIEQVDEISLSSDQVRALIQKKAAIIIEKSGIIMTVPASILNGQTDVIIKIAQLSADEVTIPSDEKLVGKVYDVTITEDGTLFDHFDDNAVTFSFVIDENKVSNTDKLRAFYLKSDTDEWFDLGGNYEDGIVTVTTDHLSVYTVMEKIDTPQDDEDEDATTQIPSNEQHENDDHVPTEEVEGEKLPETATSMHTFLLVGLILLGLGTIAFIIIKRRSRTDG